MRPKTRSLFAWFKNRRNNSRKLGITPKPCHVKLAKENQGWSVWRRQHPRLHFVVNVGSRDIQIAVVSGTDRRMLFLEDYVLPWACQRRFLAPSINFWSTSILKGRFLEKIKLSVKNKNCSGSETYCFWVAAEYLKFNARINKATDDVLSIAMKTVRLLRYSLSDGTQRLAWNTVSSKTIHYTA